MLEYKAERVINDQVGREPVLVAYKMDSDTVTVFSRTLNGRTLRFDLRGPTGAIVDAETGSRWSAYGECVDGKLRGSKLKALIGMRQFWWAWAAFYPGTDIYAGKSATPR